MKTFCALVLFFLIFIPAHAQRDVTEYSNFQIKNQNILYRFTHDTTVSLADAENYYRSLVSVKGVVLKDSVLYGDLEHFVIDLTRYKFNRVILPFFMARGYSSGKLKVEFKRNRYRVTLTALIANYDDPKDGVRTPYEYLLLKKGYEVYKPAALQHDCLGILDEALQDYLTVTTVVSEKW